MYSTYEKERIEQVKKAEALIKKIDKMIYNWDERSSFKIGNVGNLSMSDLDTIKLYCENSIRPVNRLMKPFGGVADVLDAEGIEVSSSSGLW